MIKLPLSRHASPNSAQSPRRRKWVILVFASVILFLFYATISHGGSSSDAFRYDFGSVPENDDRPARPQKDNADNAKGSANNGSKSPPPFRHKHIAVASDFGAHFDVYLAFVKTLHDVLSSDNATYPDWSLQVFAGTPDAHGFRDIVDMLRLYEGSYRLTNDLEDALRYDGSESDSEVGSGNVVFDLVVFGTCEIDMIRWSDHLLTIYDARPADKKFELVCIVHNSRDTRWQSHIREWSRRGAIRLLPLASHVGHAFRQRFKEMADSADAESYTAMYEYIPIDVHVPVLDLPDLLSPSTHSDSGSSSPPVHLDSVPYPPTRSATLSRAVIQGNLETARRDYLHIFRDLVELLTADPTAWGYHPFSQGQPSFIPIRPESASDPEPFTLTLIGEGALEIPTELAHVIVIRRGLSYIDFYKAMMSMNVVVPAFGNGDYFETQASSTVAMTIQCNVPFLGTLRVRRAYGYIDDDRVSITRPQALREMEAIYTLRKGTFSFDDFATRHNVSSPSSASFSALELPQLKQATNDMLHLGWKRSREEYDAFKKELWQKNQVSARRVIEGRRGLGADIKDF